MPEPIEVGLSGTDACLELGALIERQATLREVMLAYVRYVVARRGGNKQQAALQMGIDRRTIQRWLRDGIPNGRHVEPTS